MKGNSIRLRSAILLSGIVTLLWLGTAMATLRLVSEEMAEVFDSALQETGQRILQLAVVDVLNRDEEGVNRRVTGLAEHEEHFTYVVRDPEGRLLLTSHRARPEDFPLFPDSGFHDTGDMRFYQEMAVRGTVILTIAEPLSHRREAVVNMALSLALPLLVTVPLSLIAIFYGLGFGLRPLNRLRDQLAQRGATRLAPLVRIGVPSELGPIVDTINDLLMRLERAFAAERSFAANAAHELRTPLAGALGQLQRLRHQSQDPETRRRADEVEHTLRRLIRLSEKLMQLARAEGARLLTDAPADIRPVLDMVVRDFAHAASAREIRLDLPDQPVLARVDLDAIAIVARNLIENAIRHGDGGTISVRLDADATLAVENSGPTVHADRMLSLTDRFVRGNSVDDGSGLGLAIVQTIAGRIGSQLVLHSPVPGRADGFQASLSFLPQIPQLTD